MQISKHLFLGVALVISSLLAAPGSIKVDLSSDQAIAQSFAPIVVNEIRENTSDFLDTVYYHVAQTKTHVYISYNLMKSFSAYPVGIKVAQHLIDSEDVFVVAKITGKDEAKLLLMDTNAHGKRLRYVGDSSQVEFDPKELAEMLRDTRSLQTSRFTIESSTQALIGDRFVDELGKNGDVFSVFKKSFQGDVECIGGSCPLVASCGISHATCAASFESVSLARTMNIAIRVPSKSLISEARKMLKNNQVANSSVSLYNLEPMKNIVENMTFDAGVLAKGGDKVKPCQPLNMMVNGRVQTSPPLPTHVDPTWFLKKYRVAMYDLMQKRGKTEGFDELEANLGYTTGPGNADDCPRMDPAAYYRSQFRKSFHQQGGDLEYTRHELLKLKSPAFTK